MKYKNTCYVNIVLRVTQNTLWGLIIGIFTEKNQVFRHYSCRYRNHFRANASFGWRLTLKFQLVDVFWLEEAEILEGETKRRKKIGKKQNAGQNSTKHSGNSDRLHAIRQKIARRQTADIFPPRMIPPVSREVISSAEKWIFSLRWGLFQEKNVPGRFLWSIQAKKIRATGIWRTFYREKYPSSQFPFPFVSKNLNNRILGFFKGQITACGGKG
jgi:hypothetical protein